MARKVPALVLEVADDEIARAFEGLLYGLEAAALDEERPLELPDDEIAAHLEELVA